MAALSHVALLLLCFSTFSAASWLDSLYAWFNTNKPASTHQQQQQQSIQHLLEQYPPNVTHITHSNWTLLYNSSTLLLVYVDDDSVSSLIILIFPLFASIRISMHIHAYPCIYYANTIPTDMRRGARTRAGCCHCGTD